MKPGVGRNVVGLAFLGAGIVALAVCVGAFSSLPALKRTARAMKTTEAVDRLVSALAQERLIQAQHVAQVKGADTATVEKVWERTDAHLAQFRQEMSGWKDLPADMQAALAAAEARLSRLDAQRTLFEPDLQTPLYADRVYGPMITSLLALVDALLESTTVHLGSAARALGELKAAEEVARREAILVEHARWAGQVSVRSLRSLIADLDQHLEAFWPRRGQLSEDSIRATCRAR